MVERLEARGHISISFTSAAVNEAEQAHRAVADLKKRSLYNLQRKIIAIHKHSS